MKPPAGMPEGPPPGGVGVTPAVALSKHASRAGVFTVQTCEPPAFVMVVRYFAGGALSFTLKQSRWSLVDCAKLLAAPVATASATRAVRALRLMPGTAAGVPAWSAATPAAHAPRRPCTCCKAASGGCNARVRLRPDRVARRLRELLADACVVAPR